MDAEEGGVSLNNHGVGTPTPAASQILGECRSRTVGYARRVLDQLCETLEKDLADRAADAFTNPDNSRLIEGLRVIHKNREKLGEVFRARFAHYFEQHLQRDTSSRHASSKVGTAAGFSLVEDSELEESLAINTLIGKLQERYSEELYGLSQRYGEILPGGPVDRRRLPMGPDNFCHAFRDAVAVLDLEIGAKVYSYKLFDRILLQGSSNFYSELNKYLIEKGILPQLKATIRPQSSLPHHAALAANRSAAHRGESGNNSGNGNRNRNVSPHETSAEDGFFGEMVAPVQEQMFQAMQYLLAAHYSPREDTTIGIGQTAGIVYLPATPMLVDTLSALQHDPNLVEHSGELLRGGLKQHVVGRFATLDTQGKPGVINQIDDETIDVISMIFDYILDDKTLPDFIKALIGRLQIPALKVAIVDREFFSNKLHPARQLLNELAYAGVGWNEESDAAKDRLYEKMEMTVRRILNEFDDDIQIFETLLHEFRTFLDEEKKSFVLVQEKISAEIHETDHIEGIKIRVAEEIAKRLVNRSIPEEIREFLTTTWRQLVTSITLEEGQDSVPKSRAMQVIDDLVWSVEPKTTSEQRRRLGVLLPILLEELREGLGRIGRSEAEIDAFVSVLEQYHFSSLKGSRIKEEEKMPEVADTVAAPAPPAPQPQHRQDEPSRTKLDEIDRLFNEISGDIENLPEIDVRGISGFDDFIDTEDPEKQSSFEKMMAEMGFEAESDAGPRIEDKFTDVVRKLELGTWVELAGPGEGKMRVKLAWVGDAYTNYSFVNRQYKVVAERPMYVLAEEFRTNNARVIEDVALFDRALDGVISGIMKFAKPSTQARHA